jgi:hypothetical protein
MLKKINLIFLEIKEIKGLVKQQALRSKFQWVDNADLLNLLKISHRTAQALRSSGKLPYSKIRGKIFYKLPDIEALLNEGFHFKKPNF